MNDKVNVIHTVRKDANGEPAKTQFPAIIWSKIKNLQAGNYDKQGRWMLDVKTVATPPEASPKKQPAKRGRKPKTT